MNWKLFSKVFVATALVVIVFGSSVQPTSASTLGLSESDHELFRSAAGINPASEEKPGLDCGGSFWELYTDMSFNCMMASLTLGLMDVVGLLVWLAGSLLEVAVITLVVNMGEFVHNTPGVGVAWQAIRDLLNIAFIGGFIAIAFSTILQLQSKYTTKILGQIIVAAILVNFSFFFTGAIIDSSNFLSKQIIETSKICESGSSGDGTSSGATAKDGSKNRVCTGIGDAFMTATRLTSIGDVEGGFDVDTEGEGDAFYAKLAWVGIFGSILFLITAFVFFSAALLLVSRFVILMLLLISSPVGIAGWAIPGVDKFAKNWWSALINQAFFAPVYFLLVAISLKIVDGIMNTIVGGRVLLGSAGESSALAGIKDGSVGSVEIFLGFLIASGFMWASLVIAKDMAKKAGNFDAVLSGINKVTNWGQGFVGRNTVGRVSDTAYNSNALKRLESVPIVGAAFRAVGSGLKYGSNAKFGSTKSYQQTMEGDQKAVADRYKRLGEIQPLVQRRGETLDAFKARQKSEKDKATARQDRYVRGKERQALPIVGLSMNRGTRAAVSEIQDTQRTKRLDEAEQKRSEERTISRYETSTEASVDAIKNLDSVLGTNLKVEADGLKTLHEDLMVLTVASKNRELTGGEKTKMDALAKEIDLREKNFRDQISGEAKKTARSLEQENEKLRQTEAKLAAVQQALAVTPNSDVSTRNRLLAEGVAAQNAVTSQAGARDSARDRYEVITTHKEEYVHESSRRMEAIERARDSANLKFKGAYGAGRYARRVVP